MTTCPAASADTAGGSGGSRPRANTVVETRDVDGMPFSGLVARVPDPRAVIVALHGGATTSAYFHSQVHPRASLLTAGAALGFTVIALDRPGYGASHDHGSRLGTPRSRADLTFRMIDAFLDGRPRGAGDFPSRPGPASREWR